MPGKRIGLVACSKAKLSVPAKARDLYSPSDLFRKASRYCETHCDDWYILSAKHGLVYPDELLEPYDLTLKRMKPEQKREWGERVARQIRALGEADLEAHAGKDYVQPIVEAGIRLRDPLAGLGLGLRKQWYCQQPSAEEAGE